MCETDTERQFLQLRAKGWSLARIAERLKVAQRSVAEWNRQEYEKIRTLRAFENTGQRKFVVPASAGRSPTRKVNPHKAKSVKKR